jgi:GTP cyclohydrolase FolE2
VIKEDMNIQEERHGIPMMRLFNAIQQLEQHKKLATSSRISNILKKRTTTILVLYWRWGYLVRKPVQSVNKKRNVDHCIWFYRLTKKGVSKYQRLLVEFGDLLRINSVPPEISAAVPLGDIPLKQVK